MKRRDVIDLAAHEVWPKDQSRLRDEWMMKPPSTASEGETHVARSPVVSTITFYTTTPLMDTSPPARLFR